MLALVVGAASAAFGANGDAWRLGQRSVAPAITALGGERGVNGPMVRLTNNNAGTDDTALQLRVQPGEAPMRVNSGTKVENLNADFLDGRDPTAFMASGAFAALYFAKPLAKRCCTGDRGLAGRAITLLVDFKERYP